MALLTIDNLLLSFGQRVLFDHVFLQLDRGERVGVVGDNGTGKTTLFKMIAGEQSPDSGSVSVARGTKIGYLRQDATFPPGSTVIDEAEDAFAELHALSHKLRDLEHAMAEVEGDELDRVLAQYEKLQHQFEQAGGYAWRHKLEATLLGVGLPKSTWETPTDKLSGGQRSRLALAKVLINEPDILLLDEPTNHLDLTAIAWLEDWLSSFNGAVLLISHDRYLLDRVANRIVWLARAELRNYPGNYSAFIQQRELQELTQAREYEKQQAHIAKQQEFIRRFSAGQRAREAQGRAKHLARLMKSDAMIDRVTQNKSMNLKLGTDQRAGDQVLRVRGLSKSFGGNRLWDDAQFEIVRGERIGIIGPNGSGKTTLLRTLLGELDADAGEIRWGANLNIGYYDQRLDDFDPENTIYDEVVAGRDNLPDKELRDTLALMLFRGDDVDKKMGVLSGGERARVALAELLLDKPNVLLLDEPTNHLDIASCEALEGALSSFPGTILCVSHDRYFLQKTVGRLLVIDPPQVNDFAGRF
ncbi:MAG TPA: ABC-F family ATP-binding cassette domain-containing protein, partial [Tepidisphaeraceae bacterium]|nr:ABC-F family ATP-binding cassette domain-containing protein [Tepidisphaeraceae bacterium]